MSVTRMLPKGFEQAVAFVSDLLDNIRDDMDESKQEIARVEDVLRFAGTIAPLASVSRVREELLEIKEAFYEAERQYDAWSDVLNAMAVFGHLSLEQINDMCRALKAREGSDDDCGA